MKNPTPRSVAEHFLPFIYPTNQKTFLNRIFPQKKIDFIDVITTRKSSNKLLPISNEDLAELLYYTAKVHSLHQTDSGFFITKRMTPSAGARHPVDLLISPFANSRVLSYYNPVDHSLNEVLIDRFLANNFFDEVNENASIQEACLIWFSIQQQKTSSKYENAESLYWRDAGALLYCIQIVATFLNLKSCPLGTLAANSFYSLFETESLLSGGGILVGK